MTVTPVAPIAPLASIWPLVAPKSMPVAPRIHVLSDLHLDTGPYALPDGLEFDILVAAGDIGPLEIAVPWLAAIGKPVVYVLGNHEHYGRAFTETLAAAKKLAKDTQVHVLEREAVVIQGVRFLGATLWASFGNWHPELVREAYNRMSDYGEIDAGDWESKGSNSKKQAFRYRKIGLKRREAEPGASAKFHPAMAYYEHVLTVKWLERMLEKEPKAPTVVVTHHAPTFEALRAAHIKEELLKPENWDRRYRDPDLVRVAAYATPLESLLEKYKKTIMLWAHGHMHHGHDSQVRGVRVLCNARGHFEKPLTAESIEAYRLFGVSLTMEHVKRSQEAFAANPYRGDAYYFEPSLVVDLEAGLERPLSRALVKPLEELKELRESAASLVPYLFEGAEKQQEAVARCFKDDCAQFRVILDGINGSICTHLDEYYSSTAIRSLNTPFNQPYEPWPFNDEPLTTEKYAQVVETMDAWIAWTERLPQAPRERITQWAAQAYRALAVLADRGVTATVCQLDIGDLRDVSKYRLSIFAEAESDACQELEQALDNIMNPRIPRIWSATVWNHADRYGDENPALTLADLAPWDQGLPLVRVEPERPTYLKTNEEGNW